MSGHIHTDIITLGVGAFATALAFHFFRMVGAWAANHGGGAMGHALGGFFTFGS